MDREEEKQSQGEFGAKKFRKKTWQAILAQQHLKRAVSRLYVLDWLLFLLDILTPGPRLGNLVVVVVVGGDQGVGTKVES